MDIYSKMFLINFVFFMTTVVIDRHVFDDALERMKFVGKMFQWWAVASMLSMLVWVIYSIARL